MTERRVPQEPVALLLAGIGVGTDTAAPWRRLAEEPPDVVEVAPVPEMAPAPELAPVAAVAPALTDLDARIEALLLVAEAPLPLPTLASAVDRPMAVVRQALDRLRSDYDGSGGRRRGFELREVATGWRLSARMEHDEAIRALADAEAPARLSQAALETLAVIAYRQPVSRGQVAAVRAVSVDSVMRTLQARGLIEEVGRSEDTGAVLYGTTGEFLVALGIRSLTDLPPLAPLLGGVETVHADAG
ncbi:MAG: segregation and condensation protein [Microbacteriaceae bacterium]|nr:segregation and condensation protein [Microbacteriaceae bacterium]